MRKHDNYEDNKKEHIDNSLAPLAAMRVDEVHGCGGLLGAAKVLNGSQDVAAVLKPTGKNDPAVGVTFEKRTTYKGSYGEGFEGFEAELMGEKIEVAVKFKRRLARRQLVWRTALAEAMCVLSKHGLTGEDIHFFDEFL